MKLQVTRLQKERDTISDELDSYKERFENNQSLTMKAARDKEQIQTELDVVKDRWEKAHIIHQKLQVPMLRNFCKVTSLIIIFRLNEMTPTRKSKFSRKN